jgi:putative ABC transport system substrate-binding protein
MVKSLPDIQAALDVELVQNDVKSVNEAIAVIHSVPTDEAMFFLSTASLTTDSLIEPAIKRGIAVASANTRQLYSGVLVTYAASFPAMGGQAARMADHILKGVKPANLPVETAEFFLGINLKTANSIGLEIPDTLLTQAHTIVR